jgi:hypothetical protein
MTEGKIKLKKIDRSFFLALIILGLFLFFFNPLWPKAASGAETEKSIRFRVFYSKSALKTVNLTDNNYDLKEPTTEQINDRVAIGCIPVHIKKVGSDIEYLAVAGKIQPESTDLIGYYLLNLKGTALAGSASEKESAIEQLRNFLSDDAPIKPLATSFRAGPYQDYRYTEKVLSNCLKNHFNAGEDKNYDEYANDIKSAYDQSPLSNDYYKQELLANTNPQLGTPSKKSLAFGMPLNIADGNGDLVALKSGHEYFDLSPTDTKNQTSKLTDGTYKAYVDMRGDNISDLNDIVDKKNSWYLKGETTFEIKNGKLVAGNNGEDNKVVPILLGGALNKQWFNYIADPIDEAAETIGDAIDCAADPLGCVEKAVEWALGFVFDMVKQGIIWFIDAINWMLNMQRDQVFSLGIASAWAKIRDLAISLLVLVLIIIAFANALQFDIEKYGLNRMIPKIIVAVVLSYLSWAIADALFEFNSVLQDTARSLAGGSGSNMFANGLSYGDLATVSITSIAVGPGGIMLLVLVIFIILLIAVIILAFLLMARWLMLSFLLAIAPLAFILMILPWTENYYKMWWSNFLKWLFMGPLIVLILSIGLLIAGSGNGAVRLDELGSTTIRSGGGSFIAKFLILCGTFVFAAYLPLKMGGKIMQGWAKTGKGVSKFAANRGLDALGRYGANLAKKGGKLGKALQKAKYLTPDAQKAFWSNRQAPGRARRTGYGRELQAGLSEMGAGGRFLAGVTPEEQISLRVASLRQRQKDAQMEDWAEDRLHDVALDTSQNNWTREAAFMELTERGHVGAGRSDAEKELQRLFDNYAPNNGVIRKSAAKEQRSLLMRSKNPDYQKTGVALSAKYEAKERGASEVTALSEIALGINPVTDRKVRDQALGALQGISAEGMQRVASQKGDLFEKYTQYTTLECLNDSTLEATRTLAEGKGMQDAVNRIDNILDARTSPSQPPSGGA